MAGDLIKPYAHDFRDVYLASKAWINVLVGLTVALIVVGLTFLSLSSVPVRSVIDKLFSSDIFFNKILRMVITLVLISVPVWAATALVVKRMIVGS